MLLSCNKLKHMCITIRLAQIPHVGIRFPNNLYSIHNYLLKQPLLTLRRPHHYLYNIRNPITSNGRQLFGSASRASRNCKWTGRLQIVRRGLSGKTNSLPKNSNNRSILTFGTSDNVGIKRLIKLMKNEKSTLLLGLVCLIISSTITMSIPYFLGKVIDIVFNKDGMDEKTLSDLRRYTIMLSWIFVIAALSNFSRVYLFSSAALRIVRNLRSKLYKAIIMQKASWFDGHGTGELINRLSNDTYFVGISISQNISDGLRSLAMIGVGTSMMICTSPKLAMASALVVPAIAGIAIVYGRYVRRITRKELDKYAQVMKHAEERFGNVRTVKVFCRELKEIQEYDHQLNEAIQIGYKETLAKSIFFGLTGFMGHVVILSVLYYGGTLVLNNDLTIGAMTSFMLYAGYSSVAMNGLSNFYTQLNKGLGAAERIWQILDRGNIAPVNYGIVPQNKAIGLIEFRDVTFAYSTRSNSPVLSNFSLKLLPNQTTALVGRSGTGKSTTAMLLLRLYEPQKGAIYLDGVDVSKLNPHWLRHNIGAVSQEPVLFSSSIRNNILYGLHPDKEPDEEHFQRVLRDSHVIEFVESLPQGLDTIVGQRGMLLSGGQKQRVAIARALIKDPTILVLDEATSALDAVSEHLVQSALDKLIEGRTVLTIAHRLSTIQNAHKIAVIDNKRIVEEGSFNELIQRPNGVFKELVANQAFGSTDCLSQHPN